MTQSSEGVHAYQKYLGRFDVTQMAAAQVNPCLLVGWGIDNSKVNFVPFDKECFMQTSTMLSRILLAAVPLEGKRPDMTTETGHKEFTVQIAAAMTELCSIN